MPTWVTLALFEVLKKTRSAARDPIGRSELPCGFDRASSSAGERRTRGRRQIRTRTVDALVRGPAGTVRRADEGLRKTHNAVAVRPGLAGDSLRPRPARAGNDKQKQARRQNGNGLCARELSQPSTDFASSGRASPPGHPGGRTERIARPVPPAAASDRVRGAIPGEIRRAPAGRGPGETERIADKSPEITRGGRWYRMGPADNRRQSV